MKNMNRPESKFELAPNQEYESHMREETNRLFRDCFKGLDYSLVPPVPVVPKELDKSVIFTGSVTTPFKKFITGSVPASGAFVIQPCFRAHNVDSFYNNEMPEFCSAFTGLGAVVRPDSYDKICGDTINFLTQYLNVEPENILVRLTKNDNDINNYWLENQARINKELDTRPEGYYKWAYGMKDTHGRGLTLAIRKDKMQDYQDVGNIIKISNGSGKELAVEMGFGTETLLSKIYGLPHPISAFPIKEVLPGIDKDSKMVKIGDAIMAIAALYNAGITPGSGNVDRILRRYIKGLDFVLESGDLPWDSVFLNVLNVLKTEYPNKNILDVESSLKEYIDLYQESKASFIFYAREMLNSKQTKKDRLHKLVFKAAEDRGIPRPHAVFLLGNSFDKESLGMIMGVA